MQHLSLSARILTNTRSPEALCAERSNGPTNTPTVASGVECVELENVYKTLTGEKKSRLGQRTRSSFHNFGSPQRRRHPRRWREASSLRCSNRSCVNSHFRRLRLASGRAGLPPDTSRRKRTGRSSAGSRRLSNNQSGTNAC